LSSCLEAPTLAGMTKIAAKLDMAMSSLGWSQSDLARKAGVQIPRLNEWVNGRNKRGTDPKFSVMAAFARALGVPIAWFDDEDDRPFEEARNAAPDRTALDRLIQKAGGAERAYRLLAEAVAEELSKRDAPGGGIPNGFVGSPLAAPAEPAVRRGRVVSNLHVAPAPEPAPPPPPAPTPKAAPKKKPGRPRPGTRG
jgi:transcriptional regulator with XRE-family HTH domain